MKIVNPMICIKGMAMYCGGLQMDGLVVNAFYILNTTTNEINNNSGGVFQEAVNIAGGGSVINAAFVTSLFLGPFFLLR